MVRQYTPEMQVNGSMRGRVTFLNETSITSDYTSNPFETNNITGAIIWVKATSVAGTPNFNVILETSHDETSANFVAVTPPASQTLPVAITDENPHIITINMNQCHDFARFKLDLQGGDGGDDIITFIVDFTYGSATLPQASSGGGGGEVTIAAAGIDNLAFEAWTNSTSSAAESGRVIKASAGRLKGVSMTNASASDVWLQVHDSASAPADTTVSPISVKAISGGECAIDFGQAGRAFTNGIYVCASTTQNTKTIGGANHLFDGQYV